MLLFFLKELLLDSIHPPPSMDNALIFLKLTFADYFLCRIICLNCRPLWSFPWNLGNSTMWIFSKEGNYSYFFFFHLSLRKKSYYLSPTKFFQKKNEISSCIQSVRSVNVDVKNYFYYYKLWSFLFFFVNHLNIVYFSLARWLLIFTQISFK